MSRLYKGGRVDIDALMDPVNPDPNVPAKEQPLDNKFGKSVLFLRLKPTLKNKILEYAKEEKTTANNAAILLFELAFKSIEGNTKVKKDKKNDDTKPSNE